MRIESEIKLDYKDVLLRPKRSELTSRKDVDLVREFTFPNAGGEGADPKAYGWKGVPIVASNMDTVGTFEMAKSLAQRRMLTCISKHYDGDVWAHKLNGYGVWKNKEQREANEKGWFYDRDSDDWQHRIYEHISPSIGIKYDPEKTDDLDYLQNITWNFYHTRFVCIDAANGYTKRFCDFIKKVREAHPALIIIAGNVVTGEMTEQLILNGADVVKVGVGSAELFALLVFRLVLVIPNLARWLNVPMPLMALVGILWLMAVVPVLETLPRLLVVALILSCLAACWLDMTECEGQEEEIDGKKV